MKVQGHIKSLVEEHFADHLEHVMRDPILFGDFRTALNEAEPRLYEDIQDYELAKALFKVECISWELCLRNGQEPASNCRKSVLFCVHTELYVLQCPFGVCSDEN